MDRRVLKGFFSGFVCALCLLIGVGAVGAASKWVNIKVLQGGITIYVDEKLTKPLDVNGNVIEPFVYNGTTYLPVRGIASALGKDVSWDGETSSVYIGKAPMAAQIDLTELETVDKDGYSIISVGSNAEFTVLGKTIKPFNLFYNGNNGRISTEDVTYTYFLDSKYSKLKVNFGLSAHSFSNHEGHVRFYNVEPNGTKHLIEEYRATLNDGFIPVEVDVRGVNHLVIELSGEPTDYSAKSVLYNAVLEGLK